MAVHPLEFPAGLKDGWRTLRIFPQPLRVMILQNGFLVPHGFQIERFFEEGNMRYWTEIGFSSVYRILNKLE
jgi:hypothetical protein